MKKAFLFFIISTCFLLGSCNKTMTNTGNPINMMYNSIGDFSSNNNAANGGYIGGKSGGFFSLVKQQKVNNAAAMNSIYIKRKDGKIFARDEYLQDGIIRPEWFGAEGDGRTDDWAAFKKAIDVVTEVQGTLITGSKNYHISKPLTFPSESQPSCIWIGNGATFDNTIIIKSRATTVRDLTVKGSPGEGFIWKRGQGGLFENLHAESCKKAGFGIGCEKGNQVAWATFTNLVSIKNEHGFVIDGSADKNWVNANNFIGFYARNNRNYGVWVKGIANYNTWTGLQCEGNDSANRGIAAVLIDNGKDNVFIGGHVVSPSGNKTSTVVDKGARNIYLGGRYVAGSEQVGSVIDNEKSQIDLSHKVTRAPGQGRLKNRSKERKLKLDVPIEK